MFLSHKHKAAGTVLKNQDKQYCGMALIAAGRLSQNCYAATQHRNAAQQY